MNATQNRVKWHPPPRPEWVRRLNEEGACMDIRGVVPLDEDSLLAAATREGLADFGADDWREPFLVLLKALDEEAVVRHRRDRHLAVDRQRPSVQGRLAGLAFQSRHLGGALRRRNRAAQGRRFATRADLSHALQRPGGRYYGHAGRHVRAFDIALSDEGRNAMTQYLADNPRDARPPHQVDMSPEAIAYARRAYKNYQDYFGIPDET